MKSKDIPKTTFRIQYGLYEYFVMSFVVSNVPGGIYGIHEYDLPFLIG